MAIHLRDLGYFLHKKGDKNIILEISDEDIASDPQYYGYLDTEGNWIIQRRTDAGAYRYAVGQDNYAAIWAARASQSYVLYNALVSGA